MKAKLISDQVNTKEIAVIVRELEKVIDNGVEGDVVEFGCYIGTTTVFLSKKLIGTNKKLYVYDSFEGLPNKTELDISPLGLQFQVGELKATQKQLINNLRSANAPIPIIKKAWFSDLTNNDVPQKIAFAFFDGDYYASINDSLELTENCLQPGSIVVIDDYGSQALPGVRKAVDEWVKRHNIQIRIEQSLAIMKIDRTIKR